MAMMCKTGKGSLVIRGQINNNDLHAEIRDAVVLSGVTSINGKTDIVVLTADDVEAISYSKQQNLTPEQQLLARTNTGAIDKGYVDSISSNLQTQIDNKVPTTRKINSKPLSSDITLTATDVDAISAPDGGTVLLILATTLISVFPTTKAYPWVATPQTVVASLSASACNDELVTKLALLMRQ